ncbi:MAG TPA: diiron oxygenase [Nocardioidaceae bacterium]|nr:diiron oxygenase [Nocardioidaceae bacterium]
MTAQQTYDEVLATLSEGSVNAHFDAFRDINWDDPDFEIDRTDPRWVLPEVDPLGAHPWYQALPLERQIEIGLWRQANIMKVGLQFENVLIRGVMEYVFKLPNNTPEFRYLTHEVTEETHHTQMFQEFVNRSGTNVPGARKLFRLVSPILPLAGNLLPELFFTGVLAGEEPIDHIQKNILRAGDEMHPLLQRIMQIHVAEEARHISFAHHYLRETVPTLHPLRKAALSITYPLTMRILCDVIVIPTKELTTEMGVPAEVVKELYWDGSDQMLVDLFGDVRALAEEIGLMNVVSRPLWKLLGIAGRPSRYRSEPQLRAAA